MAKCYNCGKEGIPEEAKFCPSCGKSLKVTDELIKKALDGNQDALSELYYRTYQSVYGRIRAKVSDDDTALDLVQDTYLQVFSKLDQIKEPEAFPGWVLRIARNVTVDWYRKHGKDKDTELFSQNEYMDDDDFSSVDEDRTEYRTEYIPEAALDKEETARLLDEILNDLPEEQRLVLVMRYYDEMSLSEISQELDVNINTVKTRLSRGQKKVEERVRLLERRGTKLYSLAPVGFLLLLLKNEEAQAQTIPASDMFNAISAKAVAANAAGAAVAGKLAAGAGTKTAGATVGKSAAGVAVKAAAVKTVAVVAVSAVAVGGVAVGVKKASVPDVVTFNTQYEDYTDFTMGTTVNAAVADDYDDGELYTSDTLELAVYGNEDILREDILTITFLNGLSDVPDDAWDPTEDGAGSVMAWVEESDTEGMYDLYIAGKKGVHVSTAEGLFFDFGNLTEIDFNDAFYMEDAASMKGMFSYCSSLEILDLTGLDTTNVTDMNKMFLMCASLESLDVSGFDTSGVTDMGYMFTGCASLKTLDVGSFDTSNVTDMTSMFSACSSLAYLHLDNFDTARVQSMQDMFGGCGTLFALDLSNFDTSEVTNMADMFSVCSSLKSLDISSFDTSEVTDMNYMFAGCAALEELDISGFDTSKVTNMSAMFESCETLESLDVSGFDTSNVTGMSYMFADCIGLASLDVDGFDTSQVTDMEQMFGGCTSLISLDVSNFNTSNVTEMEGMFYCCSALESLDVSGFDTSNVGTFDYMFAGCLSLYGLDTDNFDYARAESAEGMFYETIYDTGV